MFQMFSSFCYGSLCWKRLYGACPCSVFLMFTALACSFLSLILCIWIPRFVYEDKAWGCLKFLKISLTGTIVSKKIKGISFHIFAADKMDAEVKC